MNQSALLKRAFAITRRYRALWLFGILVALTTGGGGGSGGSGNGTRYNLSDVDLQRWGITIPPQIAHFDPGRNIGWIVACCCGLLLLGLAAVIVQYMARTALYRMVDQIEATGAAPTWRQGFRLGWSNRAFRIFLLELLVGIVVFLIVLVILATAASPLVLLAVGNDVVKGIGVALAVLLLLLAVLLLLIAFIFLYVWGQFWAREIALRDRGIGEALSTGYALVRMRMKDLGVMWLLMAGIGIAFVIVLLPVFLALLAVGGGVGFALGYAVHAATNDILLAALIGVPIGLVILGVPLTIISGLYETFSSSAWTLAYREVTQ